MSDQIKTATQEIIEKANKIVTLIDDFGREINIKQPSIILETRLLEILGNSAQNVPLLNYYAPLLYIVTLDKLPFTIGSTRQEIDAALERLDRVGLKKVVVGIQENFSENNLSNEKEAKEAIKKL